MHNILFMTIEGDGRTKLVIEIDMSPDVIESAPVSKTGKTTLIASSRGFLEVPGFEDVTFLLNVMHKPKQTQPS